MSKKVCKLCMMKKGLNGADLFAGKCDYAFDTDKELIEHIEKVHSIVVKREKDKISVKENE